jgi:hypothetical protein
MIDGGTLQMIYALKRRMPLSLILLLLVTPMFMNSQEAVLKDVFNPGMIHVQEGEAILVEDATVFVFSLPDVSLKLSFGKKGQGPGEMTASPYIYNRSVPLSEAYFVDSQEKVLYFSKDGTYIREKKKPVGVSSIVPVGKNFVGSKLTSFEGETQYQAVVLYDDQFEILKELARDISPAQSVKATTELPLDALNFTVYRDNIYVERSREGFLINVYDSEGQLIRQIRSDRKRNAIRGKEKKELLENFKNDPSIKAFGFENVIRETKLIYPDYLPAITGLVIADDRLYVRTSQIYVVPAEFLVLNLEGKELGRFQISGLTEMPYVAHLNNVNVKYYSISQEKVYYLIFGDDDTRLKVQTINLEGTF